MKKNLTKKQQARFEGICRNLESNQADEWDQAFTEWNRFPFAAKTRILKIIQDEMGGEYIDRLEAAYQAACAEAQA